MTIYGIEEVFSKLANANTNCLYEVIQRLLPNTQKMATELRTKTAETQPKAPEYAYPNN